MNTPHAATTLAPKPAQSQGVKPKKEPVSSIPSPGSTRQANAPKSGKKDKKKVGKPRTRRRKKLDTACIYCRRSHMICDPGRPCQRCIKRKIGSLCRDEPASKRRRPRRQGKSQTPEGNVVGGESNIAQGNAQALAQSAQPQSAHALSAQTALPGEQSSESIGYGPAQKQPSNPAAAAINQRPFFYSEHAGSEFNSLTEFLSMIDDNDMINSISMDNDPMLRKLETESALSFSANNSSTNLNGQQVQAQNQPAQASQFDGSLFARKSGVNLANVGGMQPGMNTFNYQVQQSQPENLVQAQTPSGSGSAPANPNAPVVSDTARNKFFLTAADPTTEISPEERLKQVINAKLEAGLLKPYNYAKGYQRLQNYMDNHMADVSRQRILKPLSLFRPGFRAIAKSLKDIDLILVEENFERMLLDYDRVFTSMAIPACLWRRTGEIYRGNKEFASLVEVSIDDLKNGQLTIYELMTEESSVNFWEKYGAIAFDKTQKAVLTSCNLRTRDGLRKQNCCFSFTIRRDRYNIPSCIVGNFIPIQ